MDDHELLKIERLEREIVQNHIDIQVGFKISLFYSKTKNSNILL